MAAGSVGRRWRVVAVLVSGAVAACVLAPGQVAGWAEAHPGWPGLAAAAAGWNEALAPLDAVHDWLHRRTREAVERRF